MVTGPVQGKVVARRADLEGRSDAGLLMHETRAATRPGVELDPHQIGLARPVWPRQRVLAHEPAGHVHVDVGARLIGGERTSVRPRELIEVGIGRRVSDGLQP